MIKNHIVISRYNENLNWVNELLKHKWIHKIIIYNKGRRNINQFTDSRVIIYSVKNLGREGGTYLDYIINNYYDLPTNLWFTQADPFEHSPDFLHFFEEKIKNKYTIKPIQSLTIRWKKECNIPPDHYIKNNNCYNIDKYRCIDYFIKSDNLQVIGHSNFYDYGVEWTYNQFINKYKTNKIFDYLCNKINIKKPKNIISLIWSACFFVKKKSILRHPKEVYIKLKNFLLETDTQGSFQGYILERFWPYLFTGQSYNTIKECYKDLLYNNKGVVLYCNKYKKNFCKYIESQTELIENKTSILFFKKNNKIYSLPGLDFKITNIFSINRPLLDKKNIKFKNLIKSDKKYAIILEGHIKDGFNNDNLKFFIKMLIERFGKLDIYIQTWEHLQIFDGLKWIRNNNTCITEDKIIKYFGLRIKTHIKKIIIQKNDNEDMWENIWREKYNIMNDIINSKEKYEMIINTRLDFFGDYISSMLYKEQEINLNFDIIYNKLVSFIINKNKKIKFIYEKPALGMENFYMCKTKLLFNLSKLINNKFDKISDKIITKKPKLDCKEKIILFMTKLL
jgi:hypothetical protein